MRNVGVGWAGVICLLARSNDIRVNTISAATTMVGVIFLAATCECYRYLDSGTVWTF